MGSGHEISSVQVDLSSMPIDLLNVTEVSSQCNSMPINLLSARDRLRLEQEEGATTRLQRRCQKKTATRVDRGR